MTRPARHSVACAGFVGLALLALACGSGVEHRSLTLQLSASPLCVRTSLACGGEIGVTVVDASDEEVLDQRCVPFAPDPKLQLSGLPAALAALMPPLAALAPGREIALEVAVYAPATGLGCPRYSPSTAHNRASPSYFGRSASIQAGTSPAIAVPLQCYPSTCVSCTKYASPTGSDTADGASATPFATVTKLVKTLTAGQTGCLLDGSFVEDVTFEKGGNSSSPIALAAAPGAHPTLEGLLTIPETTDYIAVANLTLVGSMTAKSPSPLVRGDHVALRGNDITNPGADCVVLGDPTWGPGKSEVIEDNRIHGCKAGVVARIAESSLIDNNFIYDNTGDGVSLYPDGNAITVEHNVIDGNGSGVQFGSDGRLVSSGNTVRGNVISNATTGYNVYGAFPGALGTRNVAAQNCLWMGKKGDVAPTKGFTATENTVADPLFADRAAKDFRVGAGSLCTGAGVLR